MDDKVTKSISVARYIFSMILSSAALLFGFSINKANPILNDMAKITFLVFSALVPIVCLAVNIALSKKFNNKWDDKSVLEVQDYVLSHREKAEETSREKRRKVKKLMKLKNLYSAFLFIFAFLISFFAGMVPVERITSVGMPFVLASTAVFVVSLSRITLPVSSKMLDDNDSYISEDDFPEFYALAHKAAKALGCDGKIKIAILNDFNAGISRVGDTYSVQLGAIMLGVLTENEIYTVLLHEFSHMANDLHYSSKEGRYAAQLENFGGDLFFSWLIEAFFSYIDLSFNHEYSMYAYSISLLSESIADKAMAEFADKRIAASALLKLHYFELYMWENEISDEDSFYESEVMLEDGFKRQINSFKKSMKMRVAEWCTFAENEILSRSASHPTLKMRLDTLGVSEFEIVDEADSDIYVNECEKAIAHAQKLNNRNMEELYDEARKFFYLEPLEIVEKWTKDGCSLVAEEYADVCISFARLGRFSEAEALCDRAIAELDSNASLFAKFLKGTYMLHRFDENGIELIYEAIENNSNYLDEGLDLIGKFCCLTGNQKQLDEYRKRAIELGQMEKDVYSQLNILSKKDNLCEEHLPNGMLDEIKAHIIEIGDGDIERIFLVRKVITDDFFTSVFIVESSNDIGTERRDEIFHNIFCYLDTCSDWQFSLFDYYDVRRVPISKIPNSLVYSKQ